MTVPTIRIAYAEDHPIVRMGVVSYINSFEGMHVDIEADDGKTLITALEKATDFPDICLLDISMPGMNGFETIVELKQRWPELKVLVFTVFEIDMYIIRMIKYGANGYLLKSCNSEEIKRAIYAIHNTGMYYSDKVTSQFIQDIRANVIKLPKLTDRDMQILKYACSDLRYSEIAEAMGTTTKSVEGARDYLFKKLNVNSRTGLAMYAVQFGIVPIATGMTDDKTTLTKSSK